MNIDSKILNKIIPSRAQQCTEGRERFMEMWAFSLEYRGEFSQVILNVMCNLNKLFI